MMSRLGSQRLPSLLVRPARTLSYRRVISVVIQSAVWLEVSHHPVRASVTCICFRRTSTGQVSEAGKSPTWQVGRSTSDYPSSPLSVVGA